MPRGELAACTKRRLLPDPARLSPSARVPERRVPHAEAGASGMKRANLPNTHEAVLRTLPLFEMARMRAATAPRRHAHHGFAGPDAESTLRWLNTFTHSKRLLTPSDREVVT